MHEYPLAYIGTGTVSGGAGIWVLVMKATTIVTMFFGLIAAFCGAVTGIYGLYLLYRKFKKGTLFKDE